MQLFGAQAPAVHVQSIFMLMRRASIFSRGGLSSMRVPNQFFLVPCTGGTNSVLACLAPQTSDGCFVSLFLGRPEDVEGF